MFVRFLIGWALLAVAFGITAWLLDGMEVSGGVWGYIWVSALFGIVNAILGTILRLITLPLILLTFGLLAVLINALMLQLTDALTDHLTIDEFWWTAIWAAIILSLVSFVLAVAVNSLVWRERPAASSGAGLPSGCRRRSSPVAVIQAAAAARTAAGTASTPCVPTRRPANSMEVRRSRDCAAIPAAAPAATAQVGETSNQTTGSVARPIPRKTAGKIGPPRNPQARLTA